MVLIHTTSYDFKAIMVVLTSVAQDNQKQHSIITSVYVYNNAIVEKNGDDDG